MNQLSLPVKINPDEVARKKSLGAALELCAEVAGFAFDKQLQAAIKADKGQFSRWLSGEEGIKWPKFCALMDACGNDAPLLWMAHQRGYDLHAMRPRETEFERALRETQEKLLEEQKKVRTLTDALNGRVS